MIKNIMLPLLISILTLNACNVTYTPQTTTPSKQTLSTQSNNQLTEHHFLGNWLVIEASTPTCQEITTFHPNHTWMINSNESKTSGIWSYDNKTQKLTMQFINSNLQPDCEDNQLDAEYFNQIKGINALHNVKNTPQGLLIEMLDNDGKPTNNLYHLKRLS